jgi:thioredoxin-related protein
MKCAFFILLLLPFIVSGEQIQFQNISLKQALAKSKDENKPVFFMGFATWCEHCHNMRTEVFTDSGVANFYNSHFICIEQDMEKGAGVQLHSQFHVQSYPTCVFLDGNGTVLYQTVGEYNAADFIQQGKNALTPTMQLPYLKQQFYADVSDPTNCYQYLVALRRGMLDFSDVARKYFATKTDQELMDELNWKILANAVTDIHSLQFQFILNHQKEYGQIASPARVQRKITYTVQQYLDPFIANSDTAGYFKERSAAAAIHNHQVDSLLFTMDIALYEGTNNWPKYQEETLQLVKVYVWNDYHILHDIADNYLKHIDETSALAEGASWAKHALELNQDYGTYILAAKLFLKAGDKSSATEMAQEGKDLATKNGWSTAEADQILSQLSQ